MFTSGAPLRLIFLYLAGKFYDSVPSGASILEINNLRRNLDTTKDWFSGNAEKFGEYFDYLSSRAGGKLSILEIGSWEGLSACWMLTKNLDANITCVDTWCGSDEHRLEEMADVVSDSERRFDSNTSMFGGRVVKRKGTSLEFFASSPARESFDFIYVDGSHHANDVLIDALLAFRCLKKGGIIVFDDYFWKRYEKLYENPAFGINCFLKRHRGELKVIGLGKSLSCLKL